MMEGLARLNWTFILEIGLGVFGAQYAYGLLQSIVSLAE